MTNLEVLRLYGAEPYKSALAEAKNVSEAQRIMWTDHGITPERFADTLRLAGEGAGFLDNGRAAFIKG